MSGKVTRSLTKMGENEETELEGSGKWGDRKKDNEKGGNRVGERKGEKVKGNTPNK